MAGPGWRADALAAVMIMIAVCCAGRLALSVLRRRETEFDTDGVHAVMGVAMAGMFLPRLSLFPAVAWEAMFGAGAAWFAMQTIRARRGNASSGGWRCRHPLPHLVECIAMLYMLLSLPGSRAAGAGAGPGMSMPGMGGASGGAGNLPAVPAVLALFMVGYLVWAVDQLTSRARGTRALATAGGPVLAPRFATFAKMAMSMAMGYMLVLMI